jgi:hypothetical protein
LAMWKRDLPRTSPSISEPARPASHIPAHSIQNLFSSSSCSRMFILPLLTFFPTILSQILFPLALLRLRTIHSQVNLSNAGWTSLLLLHNCFILVFLSLILYSYTHSHTSHRQSFILHYVLPTRQVQPPRASRTTPGIDSKWIGHPSSALSGAALISLFVFA